MAKQPQQKTKNNKPAANTAGAGGQPAAITNEKKEDALNELDDLDNLDAEEEGGGEAEETEEPEEEVFTEKDMEKAKAARKEKKVEPKVVPRENFVLDRQGQKRLDEDKEPMRYAPGNHRGVGFVNENRVLFPVHFRFKGGFVGTRGNVVIKQCPSCGHIPSVDDSLQGRCPNPRAGAEKVPCEFDQVALLNEITLDDL